MAFGVTNVGLDMPRMADYRLLIRNDFETRLTARGVDLPDWANDTFLGDLVDALASRLDELSEAAIQIDGSYDPYNAQGLQLENLCALIGVVRREATYSTVTLSLTANIGTSIPIGTLVSDDEDFLWEATTDTDFAVTGSQDVVFQCTTPGAIEAPANTVETISTPVSGWTAVTQATAASAGRDRETDSELRRRRLLSLQRGTQGTVAGIRAAVFDLDWTTAVTVVDNPENTTQTVEGISMPQKSLAVVVYPASPTAAQITELVETLAGVVTAGIEQVGTVTDTHTFDDGHTATFAWDYATEAATNVTVSATALSGYSTSEVQAQIELVISNYFLALGVGDDVRALPIAGLVDTVAGVDTATVTVGAGAQKVSITATEIATEGTVSVTVT